MRKYFAELLGTLIIVTLGCGVASMSEDILMIAISFGIAFIISFYMFATISGAHFNPVVTISFLVLGKIRLVESGIYIIFQILGAFLGVFLLKVILGGDISYGVNYVRPSYVLYQGAIFEFVFSFLFVLTIIAVTSRNAYKQVAGLVIGLCLTAIHLIGIPITGVSLNPARSIAPAIMSNNITAISELWIFIFVPIVGGIIASIVWEVVFVNKK